MQRECTDRVYYANRLVDGLTNEELAVMLAECQTIEQLKQECTSGVTAAYATKQLHTVPQFPVVDRAQFIIDRCRDKIVMDIGATGPLHDALRKVSARCYGITRPDFPSTDPNVRAFNLDDVRQWDLPQWPDVEIVVCGEVLEHLSNPGWFMERLQTRYGSLPERPIIKIFTVPNAFTSVGQHYMRQGVENVNVDHVAFYSHRTLRTLLERFHFTIKEWAWYKGLPRFAEGLICVAE